MDEGGSNARARVGEGAARARLGKGARLQSALGFRDAYRDGSRAKGSIVLVVACANGLAHSRVGLSIGKVVWKSAVKRNRIRRVFREAFRLEQASLPKGYDFVLLAAEPKLEPKLAATRAELVSIARKAVRRYEEKHAPRASSTAADGGER